MIIDTRPPSSYANPASVSVDLELPDTVLPPPSTPALGSRATAQYYRPGNLGGDPYYSSSSGSKMGNTAVSISCSTSRSSAGDRAENKSMWTSAGIAVVVLLGCLLLYVIYRVVVRRRAYIRAMQTLQSSSNQNQHVQQSSSPVPQRRSATLAGRRKNYMRQTGYVNSNMDTSYDNTIRRSEYDEAATMYKGYISNGSTTHFTKDHDAVDDDARVTGIAPVQYSNDMNAHLNASAEDHTPRNVVTVLGTLPQ